MVRQFAANHFPTWGDLREAFYTTFRPSNYQDRVLHELHKLTLRSGETVAELMTRAQVLVAKLPAYPGDFMVRQWVQQALPRSTQQRLTENLKADVTLVEFQNMATQLENARLLFCTSTATDGGDPVAILRQALEDPVAKLRQELDSLKLQQVKHEEETLRQEISKLKGEHIPDDGITQLKQELEKLKAQQEVKRGIWCTGCQEPSHSYQDCPKQKYCHFCEKGGHEDKDCYYLKGFRQLQQHIPQGPIGQYIFPNYPAFSSPSFTPPLPPLLSAPPPSIPPPPISTFVATPSNPP